MFISDTDISSTPASMSVSLVASYVFYPFRTVAFLKMLARVFSNLDHKTLANVTSEVALEWLLLLLPLLPLLLWKLHSVGTLRETGPSKVNAEYKPRGKLPKGADLIGNSSHAPAPVETSQTALWAEYVSEVWKSACCQSIDCQNWSGNLATVCQNWS